jgi:N-methylhydantoinase B
MSMFDNAPIAPGERIRVETAGGGGWGNPSDREANRVTDDIIDGYTSERGAHEDYGTAS